VYTFVDPLYRAQKQFASEVAMVSEGGRLTYAETWSRCRRLAGVLTRLGVEPGDRVAVLALNSHWYLEIYLAVPASGRVVVPLNTRHAEPELRYALEDAGARLLITDRDPTPPTKLDEAAELLRIHRKTLQRMARNRQIHGIQVGKLWRFRASDLETWLRTKKAG